MLEVDEEGVPFAVQENVFGAEVAVDDTLLGALLSLFAEGRKARAEVLHHRQGIRVPHPGDGAQELVPKLTRLLGAGLRVWYLMAAPETPAPFQGTLSKETKRKTPPLRGSLTNLGVLKEETKQKDLPLQGFQSSLRNPISPN